MTSRQIIVVDVEATCWEPRRPDLRNEIIEIGVTPIDVKTRKLGAKESILVIPPTTEISEFCTSLTSITPEMIDKDGISFKDAIKYLSAKYDTQNNVWASYGEYDKKIMMENCEFNRVRYPFSTMHFNVKELFGVIYDMRAGMQKAGMFLKIPMEGTHHRGDDDSYNIAKILSHLLWNC